MENFKNELLKFFFRSYWKINKGGKIRDVVPVKPQKVTFSGVSTPPEGGKTGPDPENGSGTKFRQILTKFRKKSREELKFRNWTWKLSTFRRISFAWKKWCHHVKVGGWNLYKSCNVMKFEKKVMKLQRSACNKKWCS